MGAVLGIASAAQVHIKQRKDFFHSLYIIIMLYFYHISPKLRITSVLPNPLFYLMFAFNFNIFAKTFQIVDSIKLKCVNFVHI